MSVYVVDTHALAWYLSGSPLLGDEGRDLLDKATRGECQIIIPAIVIAELVMLVERRRAFIDLSAVIAKLREYPTFRLTSLTPEIVLYSQNLPGLPDIHDRLIAAEAKYEDAGLITRDQSLTESGIVSTIW